MKLKPFKQTIHGYGATIDVDGMVSPDTTTAEYAEEQTRVNTDKVYSYLIPLIKKLNVSSILDVGCGLGTMVQALLGKKYEAYGVDLSALGKYWRVQSLPKEHFFVVGPSPMKLPFYDNSLGFVYSIGVAEHVGTSDGHAAIRPDYHNIRREWLREIYRVVRLGGFLLIGGPNRNFPIDVAHGLDAEAGSIEKVLSRMLHASIHRVWSPYFLWGYRDIEKYLLGLPYRIRGLSVYDLLAHGRVPKILRPLTSAYTRHLPKKLLTTGFNPWMMALIQKQK